jgi:hypothetical protein
MVTTVDEEEGALALCVDQTTQLAAAVDMPHGRKRWLSVIQLHPSPSLSCPIASGLMSPIGVFLGGRVKTSL